MGINKEVQPIHQIEYETKAMQSFAVKLAVKCKVTNSVKSKHQKIRLLSKK